MPNPDSGSSLRREAAPLKFEDLTSDQQEAGKKAAELLKEMAEKTQPEPRHHSQHPYLPEIDLARHNHVVLIDGQRGAGKSELLVSLLQSLRDAAADAPIFSDFQGLIHSRHRIVPVGLVDLQPLPDDTNLLFYLLGHVEQVIRAMEATPTAARGPVGQPWEDGDIQARPSRRAWRDFTRAAAFGWQGNLTERRSKLDPEAFAVEVEYGELERIDVVRRFRRFMDVLSEEYREWRHWEPGQKPFFLLAIDDADMNPKRSGELLELVRKLWHPRLGFLLTGDTELFRTTLQGQFMESLKAAGEERRRGLAYDVYNKVIPHRQRCELRALPAEQRILFPRDNPLGKTLEKFEVQVRDRQGQLVRSRHIGNLGQLFREDPAFSAAFSERLRSLLSFQHKLDPYPHRLGATYDTSEAMFHIWEQALDGSGVRGSEHWERLHGLVQWDKERRSLTCDATPVTATAQTYTLEEFPLRPGWLVRIGELRRIDLSLRGPRGTNLFVFPPRLRGGFLAAYEFALEDARNTATGEVASQVSDATSFIELEWERERPSISLTFTWPFPEWRSPMDVLRFNKGWRAHLRALPGLSAESMDQLAWCFLSLVVHEATYTPAEKWGKDAVPDWAWLTERLKELQKQRHSERARLITDWVLHDVGLFAVPESGTTEEFAAQILKVLDEVFGKQEAGAAEPLSRSRHKRITAALKRQGREPNGADTSPIVAVIDSQFPGHPFHHYLGETFPVPERAQLDLVARLREHELHIEVPFAKTQLDREFFLSDYLTEFRGDHLALNSAAVLEKARSSVASFRNIPGSTSQALVDFWEALVAGNRQEKVASWVQLRGERVSVTGVNLMERLEKRMRPFLGRVPRSDLVLQVLEGLEARVGTSPKTQEGLLRQEMRLGLEAVFRMVHDYSQDQANAQRAPEPAPQWWPHFRVTFTALGLTFCPWPAVPWPTLWEWELLEKSWVEGWGKARRLVRADDTESVTLALDSLAYAFVATSAYSFSRGGRSFSIRSGIPESSWRDLLARIYQEHLQPEYVGRRRAAMRVWAQGLAMLATPEAGLSVGSTETILNVSLTYMRPDWLARLRRQRLVDAGIPEYGVASVLNGIDSRAQGHPWLERIEAAGNVAAGDTEPPQKDSGAEPKPKGKKRKGPS